MKGGVAFVRDPLRATRDRSESCLPFEFTQLIVTDTVAGLAGVAGRAQLMSHLLNSAATSARSPRRATLRTDAAPECFAKHTDQITAMVQQPRAISASARARRSVSRARLRRPDAPRAGSLHSADGSAGITDAGDRSRYSVC